MSDDDALVIPATEVHRFRSEHVGDEFNILIGHCGAPEPGVTLPVLFVSDTIWTFGTAVEMVRLMHFVKDVPALLVVGIGYRVSTIEETWAPRYRDLTPTIEPSGVDDAPLGMGGADRFLAFIRDELKPWLAERFGADVDDCAFFGDSLGGLFATYVLLTEPATFARYGIGSPSYWWDDELMFRLEEEYAGTHDDLDARVFVSVGELETPAGAALRRADLDDEARAEAEREEAEDPMTDMVEHAERMSRQLLARGYPSLALSFQVLPGEHHHTAPPGNLSRSLRYLYDAPG